MQLRFRLTYRTVLAASAGVAIVLATYRACSRDGQIHTVFETSQRQALARYVQRHVFDYRLLWSYFDGTP